MSQLVRRGFLGVELLGDAEAFGPDGVAVAGVVPGGMAERAGVAPGDRITAIAGLPTTSLCELGIALRRAGASPTTVIAIARGTERLERSASVAPHPRDDGTSYGELAVDGARLRTIVVATPRPRAVVVVIAGIACESVDHAASPFAALARAWAAADLDSFRFDKRGVGDSDGGPCDVTDFATELADARAAVAAAAEYAGSRGAPLVVFGHSVGGMIAPLVAGEHAAAIAVYGTPVMRWLACLVDTTRRQLALRGAPPDEIERQAAALEALATGGGLNGRSAAYHAQLDAIDPAAAWRAVRVPIFVGRGEHDWVVEPTDQARIPGELVDLPGLDHMFGWHADREASLRDYGAGRLDDSLARAIARWLDSCKLAP